MEKNGKRLQKVNLPILKIIPLCRPFGSNLSKHGLSDSYRCLALGKFELPSGMLLRNKIDGEESLYYRRQWISAGANPVWIFNSVFYYYCYIQYYFIFYYI